MTTTAPTLTEALVASPASVEHRLAVAMGTVAERIRTKPEVVAALAAAEAIIPGVLVQNDAEAAALFDAVKQVIAGEKVLKLEEGLLLRIPKAMETAVRNRTNEWRTKLDTAKNYGNDAQLAYKREQERRARTAQERLEREAREAQAAAASEAAMLGEDAPPPAEIAVQEPPKKIAVGGLGASHTQVRINPVEIVDPAQAPVECLAIIPAVARAMFASAVLSGGAQKPAPGESVVWRGMRFEAVESVVNR